GYNARVEKVLRDALKRGELNSRRNLPPAAVMPERISERRAQLREQLDELEITERVLRRFGQAETAERPARTASPAGAQGSARSARQAPTTREGFGSGRVRAQEGRRGE